MRAEEPTDDSSDQRLQGASEKTWDGLAGEPAPVRDSKADTVLLLGHLDYLPKVILVEGGREDTQGLVHHSHAAPAVQPPSGCAIWGSSCSVRPWG